MLVSREESDMGVEYDRRRRLRWGSQEKKSNLVLKGNDFGCEKKENLYKGLIFYHGYCKVLGANSNVTSRRRKGRREGKGKKEGKSTKYDWSSEDCKIK